MSTIEFKKQKKDRFRSLLFSLISIIIFSSLISDVIQKGQSIKILIFIGMIVLTGVMLFKAVTNKSSVIVGSEGIRNNTNGIGLIRWEYIAEMEIKNISNDQALVINVTDSEKLLAEKNPLTRMLLKFNMKRLGSPVVISQREFNKPLPEVIEEIRKFKASL
jgi:hypothetical protein